MDATVIYRADVENKSTMKEGYISYLQQKLLKNGLETIKKISTTSNTAKILSCQIYMVIKRCEWLIMEKVHGKTKIDCCSLCLAEKLHLIKYFDDIRLLNKRSEFINHGRQQN